jgi:hypothetical protein
VRVSTPTRPDAAARSQEMKASMVSRYQEAGECDKACEEATALRLKKRQEVLAKKAAFEEKIVAVETAKDEASFTRAALALADDGESRRCVRAPSTCGPDAMRRAHVGSEQPQVVLKERADRRGRLQAGRARGPRAQGHCQAAADRVQLAAAAGRQVRAGCALGRQVHEPGR